MDKPRRRIVRPRQKEAFEEAERKKVIDEQSTLDINTDSEVAVQTLIYRMGRRNPFYIRPGVDRAEGSKTLGDGKQEFTRKEVEALMIQALACGRIQETVEWYKKLGIVMDENIIEATAKMAMGLAPDGEIDPVEWREHMLQNGDGTWFAIAERVPPTNLPLEIKGWSSINNEVVVSTRRPSGAWTGTSMKKAPTHWRYIV